MSPKARLAAPPPLQRFVNDQIHTGSGWYKGLNDEQQELTTHRLVATIVLG
jgi:hypothetical protein